MNTETKCYSKTTKHGHSVKEPPEHTMAFFREQLRASFYALLYQFVCFRLRELAPVSVNSSFPCHDIALFAIPAGVYV